MRAVVSERSIETWLRDAANILRGPVHASDFKAHIFPPLFLKQISDLYDEERLDALSVPAHCTNQFSASLWREGSRASTCPMLRTKTRDTFYTPPAALRPYLAARRNSKCLATAAPQPTFVAIDFETADYGRDSACALALVPVEAGVIVQRAFHCTRPLRQRMIFTCLHNSGPSRWSIKHNQAFLYTRISKGVRTAWKTGTF